MNHTARSEYKLLGKDGKMQFENEFNFMTTRPAPVIKIKLKKLKDGLYFSYSRESKQVCERVCASVSIIML